jgi:hypothetical protein
VEAVVVSFFVATRPVAEGKPRDTLGRIDYEDEGLLGYDAV